MLEISFKLTWHNGGNINCEITRFVFKIKQVSIEKMPFVFDVFLNMDASFSQRSVIDRYLAHILDFFCVNLHHRQLENRESK